jgi:energy-converting hydrogenase Eha subunit C
MLPARIKLPFAIFMGSLIFICLLVLLSNPLSNIILVSLFFLGFYVFLNSLGFLLLAAQKQDLTPKNKRNIILLSTFVVVLLMFRSAKALSLLDSLLLLVFCGGLFFYLSRR